MKKIKNLFSWVLFSALAAGLVLFRLQAYGPWGDSVSTMDTPSYLETAGVNTFSPDFLTSIRSPTYPLLFKILAPIDRYEITLISEPYFHAEGKLAQQPGFDRVAIFQMWFSIACWTLLALVIFRRLRSGAVGLSASGLILLFGFSPQVADWDSIILTESLSFSLFALLLAVLIELAFLALADDTWKGFLWLATAGFGIASFLWVFLRDTNVYFLPVVFAFFLLLIIMAIFLKRKMVLPPLLAGLVITAACFLSQQATFRASPRWWIPLTINMTSNVFGYSDRVEFFTQRYGMPVSDELLAMKLSSPLDSKQPFARQFIDWEKRTGLSAYTAFIIDRPLWALKSVFDSLNDLFAYNIQPYFYETGRDRPAWLIPIADFLHPLSPFPLALTGMMVLIIAGAVFLKPDGQTLAWTWIAGWLFCVSVTLLIMGFLGETRSIIRHAMGGVVPMRLTIWVLLAIISDRVLSSTVKGELPLG
jgi:hypothetical protein